MKKSIAVLLPLLVAPTLVGCGASSSESVNLLVWEDESNIAVCQQIADDFLAYHKKTYPSEPSFTITFQSEGEAAAVSDLTTIGDSGTAPDIASITSDTLATAVKSKLIAPASYAEEIKNDFDEKAVAAVTVNDDVYAYPITAESQVIMYDKSQVSDPSIFDSFENLAASGKKIAWDVSNDDCAYYTWGLCNDSVLFGASGTDSALVDLATSQTVANWVSFLNTFASSIESASPQDAISLINSKQVVGLVSSPFSLSSLKENLGDKVGLHILPTINGKKERPFSGYKDYVVSRYSKHPSLAQEFANYLVSADEQLWRLSKLEYLPTRSSDDIKEYIASDPFAKVYEESYGDSMPMPNIDAMANFWVPMINYCQTMWKQKGSVTAEAVKTGLQTVAAKVLGK